MDEVTAFREMHTRLCILNQQAGGPERSDETWFAAVSVALNLVSEGEEELAAASSVVTKLDVLEDLCKRLKQGYPKGVPAGILSVSADIVLRLGDGGTTAERAINYVMALLCAQQSCR